MYAVQALGPSLHTSHICQGTAHFCNFSGQGRRRGEIRKILGLSNHLVLLSRWTPGSLSDPGSKNKVEKQLRKTVHVNLWPPHECASGDANKCSAVYTHIHKHVYKHTLYINATISFVEHSWNVKSLHSWIWDYSSWKSTCLASVCETVHCIRRSGNKTHVRGSILTCATFQCGKPFQKHFPKERLEWLRSSEDSLFFLRIQVWSSSSVLVG